MTQSSLSQIPLMPYLPRNIQELSSRITAEDYLATTFKWSRIVNQHLKYTSQEDQQYKYPITKFMEQNISTTEICTIRDTLMALPPTGQYKPIDVSKVFELHCNHVPMHHPSPSTSETDSLKIHSPDIDPEIDMIQ